jgi:Holliday junction resolvase RusA-like endonuclease
VTFTPRETVLAERELAEQWDIAPVEGPCSVAIHLADTWVRVEVTTCPEAESRKLRGDIDNYSKLVLDALNGRAWVDDHQIVRMLARKV